MKLSSAYILNIDIKTINQDPKTWRDPEFRYKRRAFPSSKGEGEVADYCTWSAHDSRLWWFMLVDFLFLMTFGEYSRPRRSSSVRNCESPWVAEIDCRDSMQNQTIVVIFTLSLWSTPSEFPNQSPRFFLNFEPIFQDRGSGRAQGGAIILEICTFLL